MASVALMWRLAAVLGVVLVLFGLVLPRAYHPAVGVVVLALGLVWFGSYEWFRESIRKDEQKVIEGLTTPSEVLQHAYSGIADNLDGRDGS